MTDYSDRHGDFIITYTGKRFYPLDPRSEDIDIIDIAHALSMLNRFTGHTNFPYSVAQHSVIVSYAVAPGDALGGLLHDASEAYVNDLARPLKQYLYDYQGMEASILDVIEAKYGVDTRHPSIKVADTRALVTEAAVLCNGEHWYAEPHWPDPLDTAIIEWSWKSAELTFLSRFKELSD